MKDVNQMKTKDGATSMGLAQARFGNTFQKYLTKTIGLLNIIGGVALTVMMLLTMTDVILRYFGKPLGGSYEIVGLLGAIVVAFALPQTSWQRGHVCMDFVFEKIPKDRQVVLRAVTRIFLTILFIFIGIGSYHMGVEFYNSEEVSATLQLPLYPAVFGVTFCCFVQCIVSVAQIFLGEK